jgi:hypothetical protein
VITQSEIQQLKYQQFLQLLLLEKCLKNDKQTKTKTEKHQENPMLPNLKSDDNRESTMP